MYIHMNTGLSEYTRKSPCIFTLNQNHSCPFLSVLTQYITEKWYTKNLLIISFILVDPKDFCRTRENFRILSDSDQQNCYYIKAVQQKKVLRQEYCTFFLFQVLICDSSQFLFNKSVSGSKSITES
jgi:hypothetical protein